jgi:segregation and condensation protein B
MSDNADRPQPEKKRKKRVTEQAHVQPETRTEEVEQAQAAALDADEAAARETGEAAGEAAGEDPAEAFEEAPTTVAESPVAAEAVQTAPDAEADVTPVDAGLSEGAPGEATAAVEGEATEGREPPERLKSIVESLIFASDKPMSVRKLQELTNERDAGVIQTCIEFLRADYGDRGVVLHEVAGGYQFRTNPLNAHWVQQLVAGKPVRLSRAQLETLAIVAYRQPITRPEIDEIRGVDSGGTLKVLLDRQLVRILGKKEEPGRPMLYGTTKDFLEFFNLKDLKELPTLREFYELNEDSLAKIKELDERRAAEGMPPPEVGKDPAAEPPAEPDAPAPEETARTPDA